MNFALILFLLTVATGILWCADKYVFRKRRAPDAKDPFWVEWGAGFFPVILTVFLLRSFLVEPFKIPSGSMIPTLLVGDFIAVNKFTYGIRLPVINKKIIDIGAPARGDVVVFRYPVDPSLDYIKRVIGLPGDEVIYQGKRLSINGKPVAVTARGEYLDKDRLFYSPRYTESLDTLQHDILVEDGENAFIPRVYPFPYRENCHYNGDGLRCKVPAGHYFVMGDNRDNSQDSRFWGFVPEENLVGKAFFIWFNMGSLDRIGAFK
jgi:signal peptidase I